MPQSRKYLTDIAESLTRLGDRVLVDAILLDAFVAIARETPGYQPGQAFFDLCRRLFTQLGLLTHAIDGAPRREGRSSDEQLRLLKAIGVLEHAIDKSTVPPDLAGVVPELNGVGEGCRRMGEAMSRRLEELRNRDQGWASQLSGLAQDAFDIFKSLRTLRDCVQEQQRAIREDGLGSLRDVEYVDGQLKFCVAAVQELAGRASNCNTGLTGGEE